MTRARHDPAAIADIIGAPRSHERAFWIHEELKWNRDGARQTVWVLRIGGRGVCCTGEGPRTEKSAALSPRWYSSRTLAVAVGEAWVSTGIAPSDQGRHFGELAA